MSRQHPQLHPKLEYFSFFYSFGELIATNQLAISFLEEIGLIPSRNSEPPMCCNLQMRVEECGHKKFNWVWRCSSKGTKKKGSKSCRKIFNPSLGTFFEGATCRVGVRDVLAIIICFTIRMQVADVYKHLIAWRRIRDTYEISYGTIIDYYSHCREVAEVVASHSDLVVGGEGKTVQIDETFLTKRKYNRGRVTDQMTTTGLGLYCKEDKVGLFFKVNSKSKRELWPFIQKYVDYQTSRICTDSAKQYEGVEQMFSPNTIHLRTNHNIDENVDKGNPANIANDLENQNKLLKKSIKYCKTSKLLHQDMALNFYRKAYLSKYKGDYGSQIMQFLLDIKKVYPGSVKGHLIEGLSIKEIDPPSLSSSDDETFLPAPKIPRLCEPGHSDEQVDDIESAIEDDSDPEYITDDIL